MDGAELVEATDDLGRASSTQLGGPVWVLRHLDRGDQEPVEVEVTLEFDGDGGISGLGGCNEYEGKVTDADGRQLGFAVRSTTARRCPADMTGTESEFSRRFDAVERFAFQNGRLLLEYTIDGEAGSLVFDRRPRRASAPKFLMSNLPIGQ